MAYLSGRQSVSGQLYGAYSQDDVDALRALAEEPGIIDIFLTYPLFINLNSLSLSLSGLFIQLCSLLDIVAFLFIFCLFHFLNYILLMSGPVGS